MSTPDGYIYCTGGRVFLACQRCGALICDSDDGIEVHDAFHDGWRLKP